MKKSLNVLPFFCLSAMLLFLACESKQKLQETETQEEDIAETYRSVAEKNGDSIIQENVSNQCALIYCNFDELKEQLTTVKSPDALIRVKKEYLEKIDVLTNDMATLDPEEQKFVTHQKNTLDSLYRRVCQEYEVPANGVIDNLNHLIARIDQVKTKDELNRFEDVRYGMLQKLDDIYLCVEHTSNRISEVKRLAQILKNKYETKKHELSER